MRSCPKMNVLKFSLLDFVTEKANVEASRLNIPGMAISNHLIKAPYVDDYKQRFI